MLPSPPQTLGGHVCTFTWTHAHAHFASRRHAASVCEDGGSGDAARPADALTARAFAHDRYRYCTDRVQKTGGKYREALLRTSLVKKARGPGRGWRFGDPVPRQKGPWPKILHTISTYLVLIVCRSSGVALPQKSPQRDSWDNASEEPGKHGRRPGEGMGRCEAMRCKATVTFRSPSVKRHRCC